MLYLGIDQHRKQLTVNLRNENGDILLRRQVSTRWRPAHSFFSELADQASPQGGCVVIVEVCGFNDWLLALLAEYKFLVLLVQNEKRSRRKTDRRDANQLCELLWVNRQRLLGGDKVQGLRVVQQPTQRDAEDRQLTSLRRWIAQQRTQVLNKIQHLLLKHNLQQHSPTKGLQTKAARRWLKEELSLPAIDRIEMNILLAHWEQWDQQIQEVDAQVQKRQAQNPTAVLIASIPGAAAFASLALACRIGSIERFKTPKSLPNYFGIAPSCRNSGEVTQRLGSITKIGSNMARFVLGQLVLHVLRRDPEMKARYLPIKRRRGSKIARVAVMRRVTVILWHMLKHQQPYSIGKPRSEIQPAA